jgi:hypothetical protein
MDPTTTFCPNVACPARGQTGQGQGQADARRVKQQGGSVWMALAMLVKTRLWRGGEVSAQRDLPLLRRLPSG